LLACFSNVQDDKIVTECAGGGDVVADQVEEGKPEIENYEVQINRLWNLS